MHGIDTIVHDFAVILLVAGVVGWICQRVGLSVVLGYLVAGILVGPHMGSLALVKDIAPVETLAQVGIVFLMFSIGLRLSLRKLKRLGFARLLAVFLSAITIYYLTRFFGIALDWSARECLFLAAMLMVSSSAIIGKVLQETGTTHERVGQLAMGVSVLEDVVAVVMVTVLNSVVQFGGQARPPIGETLELFGAFVVLSGVAGLLLVPFLLRRLSILAGEELQTVGIAAMLFGLAMLAQRAGYSLALGAFLLGTIIAETPHRTQVERVFEGIRDIFTAVYFVAIGMGADLHEAKMGIGLIVAIAVFTAFARVIGVTFGLALVGTAVKDALRVGLSVTPIGEFSFIIAQLGVAAHMPKIFYPAAIAASLLTTLIAPFLTKHSERIAQALLSKRPAWLQIWHQHYYGWLDYLQARRKRNLLWQLSRKRFLQIGVEMLFVTGLLVFSERLQALVLTGRNRDWLFPHGPETLFWFAMMLVVLAPLVAIWRNVSALSLLFAQVATSGRPGAARLGPIVESVFKVVGGTGLYLWLATILPMNGGLRWVLVGSLLLGLVVLFFFQRKLVYWHSELEVGLQDVFRGGDSGVTADTSAPWLRAHSEWDISVTDCVLPDLADCQGKRIMELELRARFGCTVVGIGRQGYLIPLPTPDVVLYPRDKLLLIGTPEQVEAGKRFLTAVSGTPNMLSEFDEVRMESISVPPMSAAAGKDLKTLSPAQHYKIQIAGINRAGMRILNPAGDEVILSGDELLILGTSEQIRAFKDWLSETVPASA
ncbi:MAG TPA: cation:proton antiporter [Opitutaceae bacterium]|nr:cation:proton antiporter [Opitutaceae bacterium]